jgi:CheY-like chemotaxis protein
VHVLVVDDNIDAAHLLADSLIACGYTVRVAHDGPSALDAAASFHPDVALLDIGLPAMDGYELGQRLREVVSEELRLYAVTGYGQDQDRERARAAGFTGHFIKPVDIATLDKALGSSRVGSAPPAMH